MKKLLALAFFTLFIPAFPTHAEDSVSAPFSFSQPTQATVIATTSIYDAKIISQNKSNLSLSFVLGNREGEQPSVIYAVALTSKDGKTADLKVYDDPVSLSSNIMIQKNIEYQAPGYLSGSYQVMIVAKNPDGLILAMNRVGEITVSGTGEYVDASGCYLRVNGEDKRYTLLHGVDVENNESLIAHCTLKNSFKRSITATPAMETRFRSAFGKKIDFRKMDPITLEPGQSIEKDFTITKPNDPQSYDALLSFYDQNDNIISNVTDFHYVLRGLSATVQNVILDKDYYQKGDNANLSFIWTDRKSVV